MFPKVEIYHLQWSSESSTRVVRKERKSGQEGDTPAHVEGCKKDKLGCFLSQAWRGATGNVNRGVMQLTIYFF